MLLWEGKTKEEKLLIYIKKEKQERENRSILWAIFEEKSPSICCQNDWLCLYLKAGKEQTSSVMKKFGKLFCCWLKRFC